MGSVDGLLSPESTVTSLLASSGRLKSFLHPEPVHTIKYKDRNYESASEALDAYIADFQRNLQISKPSVGQLELSKGPATPVLHHSGYRNRDVLKESLTEKELDFLKLPVRPKHRDSDRLSVTTDDLLLLPSDGSLPVTRTSAFLSQSESYSLGHSTNSSSWSRSRLADTPRSSLTHRHRTALSNPHRATQRASERERSQRVDDLLLSSSRITPRKLPPTKTDPPGSLASHHLPRWITSHKSEMNFSGVTSIPDLKYPIWLRECDVPIQTVPCWVSELEKNSGEGLQDPKDQLKGQGEGGSDQPTLRELRLQFTETLGAAKSRESGGAVYDSGELFRGDRIGSLIKRAEQVLTSPSLGLGGTTQDLHGSPGGTEELLEADHSWENPPVTFKSPVPVGDAEEQLTAEESLRDTAEKSVGSSSGYSSRKHHGPVEALKQMLFSLQAVEQRVTQHKENGSKSIASVTVPNLVPQIEDQELKELPPPDTEDHDSAPGGESLQRALHHLGRLKSLVDEMNEKKARELQPRGNEAQS